MRICFFIISLASVKLKSRLLTWYYLLKTLHGHQTHFLGREWGLGMRLYVASTGWLGVSWLTGDVIFGWLDKALHDSTM